MRNLLALKMWRFNVGATSYRLFRLEICTNCQEIAPSIPTACEIQRIPINVTPGTCSPSCCWKNISLNPLGELQKIQNETTHWRPTCFTIYQNRTGRNLFETLSVVLSKYVENCCLNLDFTATMVVSHLSISKTKNNNNGCANEVLERRVQAW